MRTTHDFLTQAAFNEWHENVKIALGYPRVGVNAATGLPAPDAQLTTDYTELAYRPEDLQYVEYDVTVTPEGPPTTAVIAEPSLETEVAVLLREDLMPASAYDALVSTFAAWAPGEAVAVNALRSHEGRLYRCVQAHTTQADWSPPVVPALWVDTAPPSVIPEWVQPTGAHDSYNVGDLVTFQGSVYRSLINGNVWSPAAYPAGWELVP